MNSSSKKHYKIHDRFFRAAMQRTDAARALFKHYLSDTFCQNHNLDSLTPISESFIDDELNEHISDVVYMCERYSPSPKKTLMSLLLIEHKSAPEHMLPLQIWRYITHMLTKYQQNQDSKTPLPNVYPIIMYNGNKSPYPFELRFSHLFENPQEMQALFT